MPEMDFIKSQRPWPLEADYKGIRLFFSGSFEKNRVRALRLKNALDKSITIILFVLAALGVVAFTYQVYNVWTTGSAAVFLAKNFYNFIFALSLYGDLYLWSHFRRLRYFEQEPKMSRLQEGGKQAKAVDVFSLFSQEAADNWNAIANKDNFSGGFPNSAVIIKGLCADKKVRLALHRLRIPLEDFPTDIAKLDKNLNPVFEREFITTLPFLAIERAQLLCARSVTSLIILYTLVKTLPENSPLAILLRNYGLEAEQLEMLCNWQISLEAMKAQADGVISYAKYKVLKTNKGLTSVPTHYLDQFSTDLTALAKYGQLPFVYGREADLEEIFKLFSSKIRCIAIKGGEGTGRTTVLNELAYRLVSEEVPELLQDKRLIRLEISSIIGSNISPEAVLSNALSEAENNDNIILAIEEIHLLAKAQGTHGLNLLQVLANYLQQSKLMVIATTTLNDYLDFVQKTTNFEQLFSIHELAPLEQKALLQSVCVQATKLEHKYGLYFSYYALTSAVKLTSEYFAQQGQPQAAISLITEVATKGANKGRKVIGQDDVEKAVSERSHIPQSSLNMGESQKLLGLEAELATQVVGQKAAVSAVSAAIRRSRSGLSMDSRPIGSFLFVGPTGVGKTELAKSLARIYFGDEKLFLRLDMSEYQGNQGLEKLLGRVGDKTETIFTKHLANYPFCLLLLDEFEKAPREVWNLFLQVFDDGRLTTARGETLSLKNTIIIATSNAGTAQIQKGIQEGQPMEKIKTELFKEVLMHTFSPELLNRFDDIILFSALSPAEMHQIVSLYLTQLAAQIKKNKDVDFAFSNQAIAYIAEQSYDPSLGARPMRRFIQDNVDSLVARSILENNLKRGAKLSLDIENQELVLTLGK